MVDKRITVLIFISFSASPRLCRSIKACWPPIVGGTERFETLLRTGAVENYELAYQPERSGKRTLSLSASVKRHADQPAAVVCIMRDITERKHPEEQVRRQKTYLAALHETSLAKLSAISYGLSEHQKLTAGNGLPP